MIAEGGIALAEQAQIQRREVFQLSEPRLSRYENRELLLSEFRRTASPAPICSYLLPLAVTVAATARTYLAHLTEFLDFLFPPFLFLLLRHRLSGIPPRLAIRRAGKGWIAGMANLDIHKTRVAELLRDVYGREAALMPSNPLFEAFKELLKERAR